MRSARNASRGSGACRVQRTLELSRFPGPQARWPGRRRWPPIMFIGMSGLVDVGEKDLSAGG